MAKTVPAPAYPASASGFWRVAIARTAEIGGFPYKPSHDITANEATLQLMLAEEGLVIDVAAA